jgi:hypothetical protein
MVRPMNYKLLIPILILCAVIGIASADIFLCSPSTDCLIYETVYNGGALCTDCTVNITILNPSGSLNQSGNFSYITSGQYRYNAGILSSGFYDAIIQGRNSTGGLAFSDITLIQTSLSNSLSQNLTHATIYPNISEYIPQNLFLMILALALICIGLGYWIDQYPIEMFGWICLLLSGVIISSGNLVITISGTLVPFESWLSHWIGFFLIVASIAGFANILLTMRANNAKQKV